MAVSQRVDVLKRQLLEKYDSRVPTPFLQMDVFNLGIGQGDCVMAVDDDGHCVMSGTTFELMNGADVRILVKPDTERADIVAMLEKAVECMKSGSLKHISFPSGVSPEKTRGDSDVPF